MYENFGQIMSFENFVFFWGGGGVAAAVPGPIRVVSAPIGQLGSLTTQVLVTRIMRIFVRNVYYSQATYRCVFESARVDFYVLLGHIYNISKGNSRTTVCKMLVVSCT